jgi:hypothetical protein
MMMTEMDIETSVYYVHLTRLIAREDFIKKPPEYDLMLSRRVSIMKFSRAISRVRWFSFVKTNVSSNLLNANSTEQSPS